MADPVTGSIIGLGLLKKIGLVSLGSKLLKTAYITSFVNAISGNPIGSLIDRAAGKTVTTKENLDLNRKLLNLKGNRAGAIPSQEGALRFLGDRSGRLDDAPDIEATNQSVLELSKMALFVEKNLQTLADLNNLYIQIYYYLPNHLFWLLNFPTYLSLFYGTLDHLDPC